MVVRPHAHIMTFLSFILNHNFVIGFFKKTILKSKLTILSEFQKMSLLDKE